MHAKKIGNNIFDPHKGVKTNNLKRILNLTTVEVSEIQIQFVSESLIEQRIRNQTTVRV